MTFEARLIRLVPYSPKTILAMVEGVEEFQKQSGLRAANGLREFFVSGDVSPIWLAELRTAIDANPWAHGFAVVERTSNLAVGTAGFKGPPDATGMVEIAYGIVPSYQGQGFATDAARSLMAFAQRSGKASFFRAHTAPEKNASTSVLTKCGFQFVGEIQDPDDGLIWRWDRPLFLPGEARPKEC